MRLIISMNHGSSMDQQRLNILRETVGNVTCIPALFTRKKDRDREKEANRSDQKSLWDDRIHYKVIISNSSQFRDRDTNSHTKIHCYLFAIAWYHLIHKEFANDNFWMKIYHDTIAVSKSSMGMWVLTGIPITILTLPLKQLSPPLLTTTTVLSFPKTRKLVSSLSI